MICAYCRKDPHRSVVAQRRYCTRRCRENAKLARVRAERLADADRMRARAERRAIYWQQCEATSWETYGRER